MGVAGRCSAMREERLGAVLCCALQGLLASRSVSEQPVSLSQSLLLGLSLLWELRLTSLSSGEP